LRFSRLPRFARNDDCFSTFYFLLSILHTADRDLRKLKKPIREAWRAMEKECKSQGLHIFLTEGKRSIERQKRLYAQGRTRPWKVVTWTLHSRHLIGDAFDIAFDQKVHGSLYPSDIKLWNTVWKIGESLGLERWGRRKTPDKPHFQWWSTTHIHTPEEEEDIYKKLYDHFIQMLENNEISKEKLKDIPEEIWKKVKGSNGKEVVVEYLENLDRNELFEEFVYMLLTLWKKK